MCKAIVCHGGQKCLVDKEDYIKLNKFRWSYSHSARGKSYVKGYMGKKQNPVYIHRIIMNCPKGMTVDHINGNTLDNRKSNLRICTQKQNTANKAKTSMKCTSKYKGIHFHKLTGKWRVQIRIDGKIKSFGLYSTEKEAVKVRDTLAKKYYKEFASLNKE